ncbi:MAG: putative metal-binding motif-containing protein, partial [Deltaproteobacteria bacterium]|nr:putative metal-binding motif-containing protein [Deltaproteobacteria bacterium]
AVRPGATEACNTKDDDCDGTADEAGATGCTAFYLDADADTWGVTGQTQCLCALSGNWRATRGGDCDDADALVNPAAAELCGPRDENCDSVVLPDCLFTQRSSGLPTQTLGTIPALSGKRIRVTTLGICGDSDSSSGPNRFTAAGGGQTFSWAAGQSYVSATYTLAPTPVVSGSYRRGFSYLNVDHVTTAGAGMTVQWDYHYDWDSKYCSTQDVLGNSYSDPSSTVRAWVRYRYE